jgi:tRNA A-37 threonylcarbamoyl transferase component Bud32
MFRSVEQVVALLQSPEKVLQENSRGAVYLIHYQGQRFIAKRSKRQEQRKWIQFTSLYRGGEGARTLRNLARLYELGLPVSEPVLTLEERRYGCVVASWIVYCYVEGDACTCADAPDIAELLQQIHSVGWVHRDPHVKNFLKHDDQLFMIDFARARPWPRRYAQMYDVVLLNNCCPGSLSDYGIAASYPWYRLAKAQNNLVKFWRRLKRVIRFWAYRNREE